MKPTSAPHLERRVAFWLLAAIALSVLPHATYQPPWVSGFFFAIWAWRGWLVWRGLKCPHGFIIGTLALLGSVVTYVTFGTIFGREAGVVLLQLMLALKLLEMRSTRDGIIAIFLGLFAVLTNFLYSQTIFMGVYMLGVVWVLVATLIAFHQHGAIPARRLLSLAGTMLLQSAPLMLALFVLFPRATGPLWGMPKDAYAGLTGLSDTMSPGAIGQLALSDAIAFRADFDGSIPPSRQLYWRAIVMDVFDGKTWKASPAALADPAAGVQALAPSTTYRVTLEPHNRRWLFLLDMPLSYPAGYLPLHGYQLRSTAPIINRLRYEARSALAYRAGQTLTPGERARSLRLPPGNPRAADLGRSLAADDAAPRTIVQRALTMFRRDPFSYTLTPPQLGDSPVDEFLFDTRRGFCEHYAGSFTFLMRAAGIPARVVTGYQGGELNGIGDYLVVRQSDAHAWSEVWLPGEGWVRVDPTAAVAPERIEKGMRSALPDTGLLPTIMGSQGLAWLKNVRFSWDALNNQWNQWVLGYGTDRQKFVLNQFGMPDVNWQNLTVVILLLMTVAVLVLSLLGMRRTIARRRDRVTRAYTRFCARLAAAGVVRSAAEGPFDFARRATRARPEWAQAIDHITSIYAGLRYGGEDRSRAGELEKLVNAFQPR